MTGNIDLDVNSNKSYSVTGALWCVKGSAVAAGGASSSLVFVNSFFERLRIGGLALNLSMYGRLSAGPRFLLNSKILYDSVRVGNKVNAFMASARLLWNSSSLVGLGLEFQLINPSVFTRYIGVVGSFALVGVSAWGIKGACEKFVQIRRIQDVVDLIERDSNGEFVGDIQAEGFLLGLSKESLKLLLKLLDKTDLRIVGDCDARLRELDGLSKEELEVQVKEAALAGVSRGMLSKINAGLDSKRKLEIVNLVCMVAWGAIGVLSMVAFFTPPLMVSLATAEALAFLISGSYFMAYSTTVISFLMEKSADYTASRGIEYIPPSVE